MEQSLIINSFKGKYSFLSNFYPCRVEFDGEIYPSTEHAYQAAKTLDPVDRINIKNASDAAVAKRLGKTCKIRIDWDEIKIDVMRELLEQKFAKDTRLREYLDNTRPSELIEGNWWGDTFWGVCNGEGKNHLGKLLMEIRDNE